MTHACLYDSFYYVSFRLHKQAYFAMPLFLKHLIFGIKIDNAKYLIPI